MVVLRSRDSYGRVDAQRRSVRRSQVISRRHSEVPRCESVDMILQTDHLALVKQDRERGEEIEMVTVHRDPVEIEKMELPAQQTKV